MLSVFFLVALSSCDNFWSADDPSVDPLKDFSVTSLPRVFINTENGAPVLDKDAKISAEMQVLEKGKDPSEVVDLTISTHGNITVNYPKKAYNIKFEKKQPFLGMPRAKEWVLLANWRDRTLIKNAVAYELARYTSLEWTPSGKFVDVVLNDEFIGNYYVCEKIQVKKNRLELDKGSFLLELDYYFDGDYKFKTDYYHLPVNIKYPKEPTNSQVANIEKFMDSLEKALKPDAEETKYLEYINEESFADYFIVYALVGNSELNHPKSFYVHKSPNGKLNAGPVWDFDYNTFSLQKKIIPNVEAPIFRDLLEKNSFRQTLFKRWNAYKPNIQKIYPFVDSLSKYIEKSNEMNIDLWPVTPHSGLVGDEKKPFAEAVDMLKKSIQMKESLIDSFVVF